MTKRARIPITRLKEQRTAAGQRFLAGHWGWAKLIVVDNGEHWDVYVSGPAEIHDPAPKKPGKRRAPKAPRRAKQKLTPEQRVEMLTAKRETPAGEGYPFSDALDDIGRAP